MPMYDYECSKCHHVEESLQKMGVEEIRCPVEDCGGTAKQITSKPRHFDKLGTHSNLSSIRFHFNYSED